MRRLFRQSRAFVTRALHRLHPSTSRVEYVIDEDISNGRESQKVPAYSYKRNDETPLDFHYVTEYIQSKPVGLDSSLNNISCCKCQDDCSNGECICSMTRQSGPTYYDSTGRLTSQYRFDVAEAIHECNAACKCNRKSCNNMVIQNGPKLKLVLFKTKTRGWGVRTLEDVKRGTFVGAYCGELVSANDSYLREDDTYLFNLSATRPKSARQNSKPVEETVDLAPNLEDEQQQVDANRQSIIDNLDGLTVDDTSDGQYDEQQHRQPYSSQSQILYEKVSPAELIHNDENDERQSSLDAGECQLTSSDYNDNTDDEGSNKNNAIESSISSKETTLANKKDNLDELDGQETETKASDKAKESADVDDDHFVCDAKFYGNFTRFINHSCEPNVTGIRSFTNHQDARFPYISFFVNQDIAANTELTLSYGDNYWLVKCKRDKIFCLCKKSSCKFTKKTFPRTYKLHEQQQQNQLY